MRKPLISLVSDQAASKPPGSAVAATDLAELEALTVAVHHGLPFAGLRDLQLDESLLLYLPLATAARELVVPLVLIGDRLTIASATPSPPLDEVRTRFPNLALDIVISSEKEILAMVQSALEEAPEETPGVLR